MRSHQDIFGLQGHGAQMRRRCDQRSPTEYFFKLQEMHQGAEGSKHGTQSEELFPGDHETWAAANSTGPCDDFQQFRGGACDSSGPVIVGAGAVSRSSPSMTKSSETAGQWERFAAPDVHAELTLRTPSATATLGSVTSVDTEHCAADQPRRDHHMVAQNPLLSGPVFADRFDSTERSHSTSSVDVASHSFIARAAAEELEDSSNSSHGDHVQPHKKKQRLINGSRWSADYPNHGPENLKMVELDGPNAKLGNREISCTQLTQCSDRLEKLVQPHGANTEENEAITQAAAALLMLSSSENTCQSSSLSAGDVCRRPFSSSKTTDRRMVMAQLAGEDVSLQGGETNYRPAHSEDAMASSVLSRPCNKRRYRLISDLLAETPRISDHEDF